LHDDIDFIIWREISESTGKETAGKCFVVSSTTPATVDWELYSVDQDGTPSLRFACTMRDQDVILPNGDKPQFDYHGTLLDDYLLIAYGVSGDYESRPDYSFIWIWFLPPTSDTTTTTEQLHCTTLWFPQFWHIYSIRPIPEKRVFFVVCLDYNATARGESSQSNAPFYPDCHAMLIKPGRDAEDTRFEDRVIWRIKCDSIEIIDWIAVQPSFRVTKDIIVLLMAHETNRRYPQEVYCVAFSLRGRRMLWRRQLVFDRRNKPYAVQIDAEQVIRVHWNSVTNRHELSIWSIARRTLGIM